MTAPISRWEWVDVVNERGVRQDYRNATITLKANDTCGIEEGGTVRVLGTKDNDVLVEYTAPRPPLGTPCPSGVQLLTTVDRFQALAGIAVERERVQQQRKEFLQELRQQTPQR
jgi:hypothetical protein